MLCDGCIAGENSADICLAVNAMDLLAQGGIDVFAIASDDTDFAPVAWRLHRGGKRVLGLGTGKNGKAYRRAYDGFSVISGTYGSLDETGKGPALERAISFRAKKVGIDRATLELVVDCAMKGAADDGWCTVEKLSTLVRKERSSFSTKKYGCANMKKFVNKTGLFEIRHVTGANYVRPAP